MLLTGTSTDPDRTAGTPTGSPQTRAILVVDDEPALVDEIMEYLAYDGYEVTPAHDGEAALDLYRLAPAGHFAVVLTDLRMPGLTGYDLARAIIEQTPHDLSSEVIVITGHAIEAEAPDGVYAVLQKPFRLSALAELVRLAHDAVMLRRLTAPADTILAHPAVT